MAKTIRYVLRCQDPETKKLVITQTTKTLEAIGKKMASNLAFNPDWYTDDSGKRLKLKLTAEEKQGKEWVELEEYKITKDWRITGYFKWDKLAEGRSK